MNQSQQVQSARSVAFWFVHMKKLAIFQAAGMKPGTWHAATQYGTVQLVAVSSIMFWCGTPTGTP